MNGARGVPLDHGAAIGSRTSTASSAAQTIPPHLCTLNPTQR